MTGQVAGSGKGWSAVRPKLIWGLGIIATLWLLYLIAGRIDHAISQWPTSERVGVSAAHCVEFIALAKEKYGANWKSRLDPSDKTCAIEIQQAWEREHIPRTLPADPAPPATMTASQQALPVAGESPVAETYCLNVISLAKAKYGADWRKKIDPAAGKACDDQTGIVTR